MIEPIEIDYIDFNIDNKTRLKINELIEEINLIKKLIEPASH